MGLVDRLGVVHRVLAAGIRHLGPDDVHAGVGVDPPAFEVFLPVTVRGAVGVRPRDDHGVLGLFRVDGRLESGLSVLAGDDLLARDVAAALGRHLVLDVDRGDADLLVLADRALDVVDAAIARITVGDHGEVGGLDHSFRVLDHLGHRDHLEVGKTELAEDRGVAAHVGGVVTRHLREPGVERVVHPGREDVVLGVQHLAQLAGCGVVDVLREDVRVSDEFCWGFHGSCVRRGAPAAAGARVAGRIGTKNRSVKNCYELS